MTERLNRQIDKPGGAGESGKVTAYQNELFWQTTSAEILGELRDPGAVKSLFKVVMNPGKADIAGTASMALIKIGKDAVPVLIGALTSKDADIVDYAKTVSGGSPEEAKGYVRTAAVMLGAIGRGDAVAPMIQALATADSDVTRAIFARELTKLPATPESEKAVQAAYDKVTPTALVPPRGSNARAELLESLASLLRPAARPLAAQANQRRQGRARTRRTSRSSPVSSRPSS